jgi:ABC-2 type transport system ATP-binding protein
MSNAIVARNLTKTFQGFTAVNDVSLSLDRGEILGLLGPNGAGKTTTFQMLLGILTPTSGSIHYSGKDLSTHRSEILERVNFSSTYTNLPWNLKVSDNLAFISRLYRINDRKRRLAEIIDTFRLEPLLSKSVVSLSAGELTRLNLAKAFINDPGVVLLDEPTASLDPESAHLIREYILKRRRELGMSILFTSHNMSEVETVCDRVVFIHRGSVVADDTPVNLARTLDRCNVSLIVDPEHEGAFAECCALLNTTVSSRDGHSTITLRESLVSELLVELAKRSVPLHGITITRATLEDYFLSQAHTMQESNA